MRARPRSLRRCSIPACVHLQRDGFALRSDARIAVIAQDEGLDNDDALAASLRERLALRLALDAVTLSQMAPLAVGRCRYRSSARRCCRSSRRRLPFSRASAQRRSRSASTACAHPCSRCMPAALPRRWAAGARCRRRRCRARGATRAGAARHATCHRRRVRRNRRPPTTGRQTPAGSRRTAMPKARASPKPARHSRIRCWLRRRLPSRPICCCA